MQDGDPPGLARLRLERAARGNRIKLSTKAQGLYLAAPRAVELSKKIPGHYVGRKGLCVDRLAFESRYTGTLSLHTNTRIK